MFWEHSGNILGTFGEHLTPILFPNPWKIYLRGTKTTGFVPGVSGERESMQHSAFYAYFPGVLVEKPQKEGGSVQDRPKNAHFPRAKELCQRLKAV